MEDQDCLTPTAPVKLPDRLGDLLLLAIKEAKKYPVEQLNMYRWVEKKGDKCAVCLAGAVMMSLGPIKWTDNTNRAAPGGQGYDNDTLEKMRAINILRTGSFWLKSRNDRKCNHLFHHQSVVDVAILPWTDDWAEHIKFANILNDQNLTIADLA